VVVIGFFFEWLEGRRQEKLARRRIKAYDKLK
jgi:hypothetical protein